MLTTASNSMDAPRAQPRPDVVNMPVPSRNATSVDVAKITMPTTCAAYQVMKLVKKDVPYRAETRVAANSPDTAHATSVLAVAMAPRLSQRLGSPMSGAL